MLDEWIAAAKDELGIDLDVDTGVLLDLARDAAHGVARPAAPLTTFLVGYAAAQAGGGPEAVAEAARKAAALAVRWARRPSGGTGPTPEQAAARGRRDRRTSRGTDDADDAGRPTARAGTRRRTRPTLDVEEALALGAGRPDRPPLAAHRARRRRRTAPAARPAGTAPTTPPPGPRPAAVAARAGRRRARGRAPRRRLGRSTRRSARRWPRRSTALTDLPSFDTSAMDGWAVAGPGPLALTGQVLAGQRRAPRRCSTATPSGSPPGPRSRRAPPPCCAASTARRATHRRRVAARPHRDAAPARARTYGPGARSAAAATSCCPRARW